MSDTDTGFDQTTHDHELNTPPITAKKSRMPLIIIGGLLSLALCLALVFMLTGGPKDARLAVNAASKAAVKLRTESINAAYKSIPALGLLQSSAEKGKSQITFTFNSISGVEGAQEVTAMLTGSGIKIDTVYDTESFEIDAALLLLGQNFLDLYAYCSPDLITAGIPSFSSDIIGINPKTLIDDLAAMGFLDEDGLYDMAGFDIDNYLGAIGSQANVADFGESTNKIYKDLMEKGEYTHEGTQNGADIYRIKLDGDDVRAAVREFIILILSFSYDDESAADILADFDESTTTAPTEITLSVVDGVAKSFTAEMRLEGEQAMLTVTGEMGDTRNAYTLELTAPETFAQPIIKATVAETITGERYSLVFDMIYYDGYANQSLTALFTANADGSYKVAADFASTVTLDVAGTVAKRGDAVTNDIGKLSVAVTDYYVSEQPIVIDFSLKCVTEPFTGKLTPSREYTLLTDMSEDELAALGELYVYSFEQLLYSLIGY